MAKLTVAELTTPVSRQQVQAKIYEVLAVLGVNTTIWKPGGVVRTIIVAVSLVFAAFSTLVSQIARAGFLALSSGDWLTLVARHVYGVERMAATYAAGTVLLTNSGGGLYILAAGDVIVGNSVTGRTYRSTGGVTINPLDVNVPLGVAATEAGAASTADPGDIDDMVTSLLNVSVTNPTSLVGTDEETDASLRQRCTEKLGALSPMGPWDAYTSALRNAVRTDGSNLGITRIRLLSDGFGHVDCYCATPSGPISAPDVVFADEAVQQYAAPQAVTARVFAAGAQPVAITCEVWMYNTSGQTELEIKDTISDAVQAWVAVQPVGGNIITPPNGFIYTDEITTMIAGSMPEIFHVVLTVPAAHLAIANTAVPTYVAPVFTAIHQVPPPEGYRPA